ncbi:hypothetical protein ACHQM5_001440 [Ranunculus cassubicifolius]
MHPLKPTMEEDDPSSIPFVERLSNWKRIDKKVSCEVSSSRLSSREFSSSNMGSSSLQSHVIDGILTEIRDIKKEIRDITKEIRDVKDENRGIRQLRDELNTVKDGNNSDQRKRRRDVYIELRNSYPLYLTLLTILFTITITTSERWYFMLFMVMCELLFLQMGLDALGQLKELEKESGGNGAVDRKDSYWLVDTFFRRRDTRNQDAERQPLNPNTSMSANEEERNLLAIIAFACLYTFLLTVYLLAS